MTTITLKNVPETLHEIIKQQAGGNRRSINNEIIYQLERIFGVRQPEPREIIEEARKLRKRVKAFLTDEMIEEFKNEGRK